MSRTTTRISRGAEPRADSAMAPNTVAPATNRATSVLANEHPRRIHHSESSQQPEHHRRGRESNRGGLAARRVSDLPGQLNDDLRDRTGAEAQAQDRGNAGIHEPAKPRSGDR